MARLVEQFEVPAGPVAEAGDQLSRVVEAEGDMLLAYVLVKGEGIQRRCSVIVFDCAPMAELRELAGGIAAAVERFLAPKEPRPIADHPGDAGSG